MLHVPSVRVLWASPYDPAHPEAPRFRSLQVQSVVSLTPWVLLANSMQPLAGNKPLVDAIQKHGGELFGEPIKAMGTPLYTDVRLYGEAGIPGVIYGAGPRTVLESHAKRNDERVQLEDLRRATKVIARTLADLLN